MRFLTVQRHQDNHGLRGRHPLTSPLVAFYQFLAGWRYRRRVNLLPKTGERGRVKGLFGNPSKTSAIVAKKNITGME